MSLVGPTEVRYAIAAIAVLTVIALLPIGFRWIRRASSEIKVEASDFATKHLAHIIMLCHLIVSFLVYRNSSVLDFIPGGFIQEFTITTSLISLVGLLFWLLGNLLRIWAVYYQGDLLEKEVRIRTDHHLLTEGPYKLSRHPIYLGNILAELGLGLALLSWPLAIWTLLLSYPVWNKRAATEETLLREHFGVDYENYCKQTGRWCPFG